MYCFMFRSASGVNLALQAFHLSTCLPFSLISQYMRAYIYTEYKGTCQITARFFVTIDSGLHRYHCHMFLINKDMDIETCYFSFGHETQIHEQMISLGIGNITEPISEVITSAPQENYVFKTLLICLTFVARSPILLL